MMACDYYRAGELHFVIAQHSPKAQRLTTLTAAKLPVFFLLELEAAAGATALFVDLGAFSFPL